MGLWVLELEFSGFGFSSPKRPKVQIWRRTLDNKRFFKRKNRVLEGIEILIFWEFWVWDGFGNRFSITLGRHSVFWELPRENFRAAQSVLEIVFLNALQRHSVFWTLFFEDFAEAQRLLVAVFSTF